MKRKEHEVGFTYYEFSNQLWVVPAIDLEGEEIKVDDSQWGIVFLHGDDTDLLMMPVLTKGGAEWVCEQLKPGTQAEVEAQARRLRPPLWAYAESYKRRRLGAYTSHLESLSHPDLARHQTGRFRSQGHS